MPLHIAKVLRARDAADDGNVGVLARISRAVRDSPTPSAMPHSTPSTMTPAAVPNRASASTRSYLQACCRALKSSMLIAATVMLAARTARGKRLSHWVPRAITPNMESAATMLANGVRAPAARLTAVRDSPPPTGMPP